MAWFKWTWTPILWNPVCIDLVQIQISIEYKTRFHTYYFPIWNFGWPLLLFEKKLVIFISYIYWGKDYKRFPVIDYIPVFFIWEDVQSLTWSLLKSWNWFIDGSEIWSWSLLWFMRILMDDNYFYDRYIFQNLQ